MKKLMTILLGSMMVLSLVACGDGKDNEKPNVPASAAQDNAKPNVPASAAQDNAKPSVPASATQDNPADKPTGDAVTDYEKNMSEFIAEFETLSANIGEMMTGFDGSDEWYAAFDTIHQTLVDSSKAMADIVEEVPEEYQESHAKITIAMVAYADMMVTFNDAVDAYKAGDIAKSEEQTAAARDLYETAVQLWNESVEASE